MTAAAKKSASPPQPSVPAEPATLPSEVVSSARFLILLLFGAGILWLVLAGVMAFVGSLKFHLPGFLAEVPWFTYGRLQAGFHSALIYGFAAQMVMGIGLWIGVRTTGRRVIQPGLVILGVLFWNLGIGLGVPVILNGHNTGWPWLEIPAFCQIILFWSYAIFALSASLTLVHGAGKRMEVSQWYLLAGIYWFPWILAGAGLLLTSEILRGVVQGLAVWWYANNLIYIWLGLIGLATLFFFLPGFSGRPLERRRLTLLAFWILLFFGSFGGVHHGAPVSMGLPSISTVGLLFCSVAILAIAMICLDHLSGRHRRILADRKFRFLAFGLGAFLLVWAMRIIGALHPVSLVAQFTFYNEAVERLAISGFFSMVAFGAVYYIVPELCGREWHHPRLMDAQFWIAGIGVVLYVFAMAFGGLVQGLALRNPEITFDATTRSTFLFLRISTSGELLLMTSGFLVAWLFFRLVGHYALVWWRERFNFDPTSETADAAA